MSDPWGATWSIPMMKNALATDHEMVKWAVVALYKLQTMDEQSFASTSERNGQGFNMNDAYFGSELAKAVIAGEEIDKNDLNSASIMLRKYAYQLTKIKNNES